MYIENVNYHEITQQLANNSHNTDMSEYVKSSELDAKIEAVVNRLLGGGTNEQKLVDDVSSELKSAEQYLLNKELVGYNMSDILDEQDCEVEEYEKKIGKLFGKK